MNPIITFLCVKWSFFLVFCLLSIELGHCYSFLNKKAFVFFHVYFQTFSIVAFSIIPFRQASRPCPCQLYTIVFLHNFSNFDITPLGLAAFLVFMRFGASTIAFKMFFLLQGPSLLLTLNFRFYRVGHLKVAWSLDKLYW